jgi:hypothetical protein
MSEMKSLINQISKNLMKSITNTVNQEKEKISGLKTRLMNYFIQIVIKK